MNDIVFITLSFTREEYEAIERLANNLDTDVKTLIRESIPPRSLAGCFNAYFELAKRGETDER